MTAYQHAPLVVIAGAGEAELPPPPVPHDCDLRTFPFLPLDVQRIRDSELMASSNAEVVRAAVLAWACCWHQVPAASLPDDDALLARLLGYGRDVATWKELRIAGALRGFHRCSDGRWYHWLLAAKALAAWRRKAARAAAGRNSGASRRAKAIAEQASNNCSNNRDRDREEDSIVNPLKGIHSSAVTDTDALTEGLFADELPQEASRNVRRRSAANASMQMLDDAVAIWNEFAAVAGLPQVSKLTPRRSNALRRLMQQELGNDLRRWRAYVEAIVEDPFRTGGGPRGWRASFDWALSRDNLVKVRESQKADGGGRA